MAVKIISDGFAHINGHLCTRVKARKSTTCEISRKPIAPGDLVYRPMNNGYDRMHRFLASVIEREQNQ